MHKLACPKCHKPIIQINNSYKCENNHCYDLAKSKYLNLLLNPDKATNNPGDSKESLIARKAYLTKGYYDIILENLINCIKKYRNNDSLDILDLGCGEGYYTKSLKEAFIKDNIYGLDISKEAINMATKYTKEVSANNKTVRLTAKEFQILELLMSYPGRVYSAEEIYQANSTDP